MIEAPREEGTVVCMARSNSRWWKSEIGSATLLVRSVPHSSPYTSLPSGVFVGSGCGLCSRSSVAFMRVLGSSSYSSSSPARSFCDFGAALHAVLRLNGLAAEPPQPLPNRLCMHVVIDLELSTWMEYF